MLQKYDKLPWISKKYEKVCWKLFTIWNPIIKHPMNLIQKISSHSDAQKRKTKKCSYIAVAENK